MTKIKEVASFLDGIAPKSLQESYDNAGLIVGDFEAEVSGILVCLDSVEETIAEAVRVGANLIVAHHPIVFKGLKRFNGSSYVERTIIKAIQNNMAIYATHTNLDSVENGVSWKIAEKLGVKNVRVLSPKKGRLLKLETFVPDADAAAVMDAVFKAGAGAVENYSECSFSTKGEGTFLGNKKANPKVGMVGKRHTECETKIECVFTVDDKSAIVSALKKAHPYETVAYYLFNLENTHPTQGLGVVGELAEEEEVMKFLGKIKKEMHAGVVRYTHPVKPKVKRIAICGGSGSFLLSAAKKAGADLFLTSDFKYHEFFDAENELVIADIGHYEGEQYTSELLYDLLTQKFSTFAVRISAINTNPVNYL